MVELNFDVARHTTPCSDRGFDTGGKNWHEWHSFIYLISINQLSDLSSEAFSLFFVSCVIEYFLLLLLFLHSKLEENSHIFTHQQSIHAAYNNVTYSSPELMSSTACIRATSESSRLN